MVLKEELLEALAEVLRRKFKRDPSHYQFLIDYFEDYSRLDDFVREEDVPFDRATVNLVTRSHFSCTSFLRFKNGSRFPGGLYFLHPGSEKEVILYIGRNMGDGSDRECIAAYRDESAFEGLFARYRAFLAAKLRASATLEVFRGEEIEMPGLTWEDVVLKPSLKDDIRWHIESFMKGKPLYQKLGIPYKRGFLFTGPPGNGKTMLLRVIASSFPEWKVVVFDTSFHYDNADLDAAFRRARDLSPSILYFEDLDTLFNSCISLSHFLNKLDGLKVMDGTLIVATTNHPEEIDSALTSRPSRFDRIWIIDNPGWHERRTFIEKQFAGLRQDLPDFIASRTEGFSMAYLKELWISVSMLTIDRGLDSPGEAEALDCLEQLGFQVEGAKHDYAGSKGTFGFVAG